MASPRSRGPRRWCSRARTDRRALPTDRAVRRLLIALAGVLASASIDGRAMDHRRVDRRVVDVVLAGDETSESAHGYAGYLARAGSRDGAPYRTTAGWMRYALHTFDDTPVTVVLVLARDSVSRQYDVVVEDSLVATRTLDPDGAPVAIVEVDVPFAVTRGRAEVSVVVRARGGPTPALRELRTLQDHNEL